MGKEIDILTIEKSIYDGFKSVSDNVFINNAPRATADQMQDYITIDVGNNITFEGTYKKAYADFYLYVRQKKSDMDDVPRNNTLLNKLLSMIPFVTDTFSIITPTINIGGREGNFSVNVIRCDLIIK